MFSHIPVLLRECMEGLNIRPDGIYVDCTLGGAGHSVHIAERLVTGKLIGIDQDEDAIKASSERLKPFGEKVEIVKDNFKNIKQILNSKGIENVDGILMDLGVSSYQLDTAERGFSYNIDAPLDMRMSRENRLTAREIVNTWDKDKIAQIIFEYGEERFARKIADCIVKARSVRSIETTVELAEIIKSAIPAPARREGPHPARRTFQALRIAVNDELGLLQGALRDSVSALKKGGRLAVITFHSLEDRIVKETFADLAAKCRCPADFPVCVCGAEPQVELVNRKPIEAGKDELESNPRSRSAKLRIVQKIR